MVNKIIQENVIGTYSNKDTLKYYEKVGLWISEKILFKKYFKKRNVKFLDMGCGGGRTTIPLVKMGFNVFAFDITPAMVKLTKKNLEKSGLKAKVEIGDAINIRYNSNSFDYILFSFNGIEAIPGRNNRLKTLQEIYRVLKPKGIFIFTTNTQKYFKGRRKLFFLKEALKYYFSKLFRLNNKYSRINDFEYGDCFLNFKPAMFMHFSKPERVKKDLEKIGFNLIFSEFRDIIEKRKTPNLRKDYFYVCEKK
ncbi:MAG: class I SAM-dependent methyltransferase [Nanoarchaeota archaeon]|nr:class I SAM-dependent methyltransferase [Nanoarchaeota archaeon]